MPSWGQRQRSLLWSVILFGWASVAQAGTFTAYGPTDFQRTTGAPNQYQQSFHILDPSAPYTLQVYNGGLDGQLQRISSALIFLNGTSIFSTSDFNQKVTFLEKAVSGLAAANTLNVELRSNPSGTLTLQVFGEDFVPPEIQIIAPPDGFITNQPLGIMIVSFSDKTAGIKAGSLVIDLNGGGFFASIDQIVTDDLSSGELRITTVDLPDAFYTFNVAIEDRAGNIGEATSHFIFDATPPEVSAAVNPQPNADGWHSSDVTVTCEAADTLSGVVYVTKPITVVGEGAEQVVSCNATDAAGNSGVFDIVVNLDKTPPHIHATVSPSPNQAGWNNSDVTVTFDASDATSGISTSSPVTVTNETTGYLVAGVATDVAGNSATTSVTINIDKTAPVVIITSPISGTEFTEAEQIIQGTVSDANAITYLTCQGQTVPLSGNSFSCPVTLVEGDNTLSVSATDIAGNTGSSQTLVAFNPYSPPTVVIESPKPLQLFRAGPITVTGRVTPYAPDDPVMEVKVNGVVAQFAKNYFTAPGVSLHEGNNVITAVATDQSGDVGTGTVAVIQDSTPPTVWIELPTEGTALSERQVDVAGLINDIVSGTVNAEQASVTVNGKAALVQNRSFVVSNVPLKPGPNKLVAVATDRAGNQNQHEINVTVHDQVGQKILIVSGNNQTGTIGQPLTEPLVVRLVDPDGNPVPDRPVFFEVVRSNALINGAERKLTIKSDANGEALVHFTLGNRSGVGNNRVRATSAGFVGEALFCAGGRAAQARMVSVISGATQRGIVSQALRMPFVVVVTDESGNAVAGVPITFKVVAGGGNIEGAQEVVKVTDSDGQAAVVPVLGPDEGVSNNRVEARFEGQVTSPAVLSASGVKPGDPENTTVSGVVLDDTDLPIPNATVTILQSGQTTTTDEQGQFVIEDPPIGSVTLYVKAGTTTRGGLWPSFYFAVTTIPGVDNTYGMPMSIPQLDESSGQLVGGDEDVTLKMSGVEGVELTVFANSVTFKDGSKTGMLTITQVHSDKIPLAPSGGAYPLLTESIQPSGTHFDPPARVTIPNTMGLSPGSVVEFFSYDDGLRQFVPVSLSTVSEDGSVITTDPGGGLSETACWCYHQPPPPPPPPCVCNCDDGNACTADSCSETCGCIHTPVDCDDGGGGGCGPCTTTSDCPTNFICMYGQCIDFGTCATDGDCCPTACLDADANIAVEAQCTGGTCTPLFTGTSSLCAATCGNGTCDAAESTSTCPSDCPPPPVCGDGSCNGTEACDTCATDCGSCPPACGDGSCNGTESATTCPFDCLTDCGNGVCSTEETGICFLDCPGTMESCGDGLCSYFEDPGTCPIDCGGAVCGNGTCEISEVSTCTTDCGGFCTGNTTFVDCMEDNSTALIDCLQIQLVDPVAQAALIAAAEAACSALCLTGVGCVECLAGVATYQLVNLANRLACLGTFGIGVIACSIVCP